MDEEKNISKRDRIKIEYEKLNSKKEEEIEEIKKYRYK